MTEKQKKAFLKSEGWVQRIGSKGCMTSSLTHWFDPATMQWFILLAAYRIASRRKRQREGSKLRRAGWRYFSGAWWHKSITHVVAKGWYTDGIKVQTPHTRQEALQTLEKQP